MAEQYIYSRSERGFTNTRGQAVPLGYGFTALSPGMDKTLRQDAAAHCEDCPRPPQTDEEGAALPLLRKVRLPRGHILLQKSAWITGSSRDFHVAHGYVLEDEEAKAAGPANWLTAPFRLGNPNAEEGGILLDSVPELTGRGPLAFRRLKDAALGLELDRHRFCQMLLACFDALASRRQVLIACDFRQPGQRELRLSILYWIYACLPYDLWAGLGFDSVYTEKSVPGLVHLAFVDKAPLQAGDPLSGIQAGNRTLPLGGSFLVLDGQIIHNDSQYQTAWYGKDGAYARWLRQVVDAVWDSPGETADSAAPALDKLRRSLQSRLLSTPEEARLDPLVYGGACEGAGCSPAELAEACGAESGAPEEKADAPAGKSPPEAAPSAAADLFQRYPFPPAPKDIQALGALAATRSNPFAASLLAAYAAKEAGEPGASLTAVLRRYQELLCRYPNVSYKTPYSLLLPWLFWSQPGEEEKAVWQACGAESGSEASRQRRIKWCGEIIKAYRPPEPLPAYIRRSLDTLSGAGKELRAWMEEALWDALGQREQGSVKGP